MELEIGMYVRTKKQGIKKIDTIFENATVNKYGYIIDYDHNDTIYNIIRTDEILKPSFNIIDLIEVGDLLKFVDMFGQESYVIVDETFKILKPHQLKEILTHEQYEANCFNIGDRIYE